MRYPTIALILTGLALPLGLVGCGGSPQVSHDNRRVIESVLTAVSAKNAEWLSANAKMVEGRRAEGKMSDAEFTEFQSIIELGKAGQWEEASTRVYALRDAQRVTNEDLNRVESGATSPEPPRRRSKPKT